MKKGTQSGFMLTEATRYSQDIYNTSLLSTRKRINVLANTASTQLKTISTYRNPPNPEQKQTKNGSGMYARVSKLSFQAELLQQDVCSEVYNLKTLKDITRSLRQKIVKNTNKSFTDLSSQLIELQGNMAKHIGLSNERTRRLKQQIQERRQGFQVVKDSMAGIRVKLKQIEDLLGCYTGHDKVQS